MNFLHRLQPWIISLLLWAVILFVAANLLGPGSPTDLSDTCYARCP